VLRAWRNLPWTLSFLGAALALPAAAQNLDAGKSPGQIFSEVCASCHRSVRDFRNGVSASFLREHYTTSSDMASTMAAYLSGARTDPRSQPAQPGRQPASTATTAHEPAAPEPKRAQQGADPKAAATSQAASRTRPTPARADATKPAETKPPAAPPAPVLEEFEE
jgi:hypothetical protein